jgi:hypothetical protein
MGLHRSVSAFCWLKENIINLFQKRFKPNAEPEPSAMVNTGPDSATTRSACPSGQ